MRYLKISLILSTLLFMGCEGFKFQGTMCDSMQPGQVSTECHPYSEEEAAKASKSPKETEVEEIEYKKEKAVKFKDEDKN